MPLEIPESEFANHKYPIFIDFDGVLTSNRIEFAYDYEEYGLWSTFDYNAIQFFNRIHDNVDGAYFVLSTSWRNGLDDDPNITHLIYSMLRNAGFKGNLGYRWRVNPKDDMCYGNRPKEIQDYLDNIAGDYKDFLIIDDSDFGFNNYLGSKRFVKTDSDNGLLFKHMKNIWSIVGQWDKK